MQHFIVRVLTLLPLFALCFTLQAAPAVFQEEYGKATFYANSLHGRRTASGEAYDKNEFTCAHKTFPFGTKLRVTRMDNNKSVIVRVNDRGPFIEGYIVDLSRRAAEDIGMIDMGVVRVKVERVDANKDVPDEAAAEAEVVKPVQHSTPTVKKIAKPAPLPATASAPDKTLKPVAHSAATTAKPVAQPATKTAPKSGKSATSLVKPLRPAQYNTGSAPKSTTVLYKTALTPLPMNGFGVQVATLTSSTSALREAAKLEALFPNKVLMVVEEGPSPEASVYKLVVGPAQNRVAADKLHKSVVKKPGYAKGFVVELNNL
jgi:rare lipoprotein A